MPQKLFLMIFGLLLGGAAGGAVFVLAQPYLQGPRLPGSEFASLEEFRRAMLRRDHRDVKSDGSLSLRSIITPHPDDRIMYDLKPGLDVRFVKARVRTNSCGLRSPERSIVKPAGVYRIAVLGDSFAFGWGVEQDQMFPQVLEDRLNRVFQGQPRIQVLNFGVPGYSTFQEVRLFLERGLDFDPDAVLVYIVDNDFGLPFYIRNVHRSGRIVASQTIAKRLWKPANPLLNKQVSDINKLLDPNRQLQRLSRLLHERGVLLAAVINPKRDWQKQTRGLWILRRSQKIRFYNLARDFNELLRLRGIAREQLSLGFDPHPSPLGHRLRGELLAAFFVGLIDQSR